MKPNCCFSYHRDMASMKLLALIAVALSAAVAQCGRVLVSAPFSNTKSHFNVFVPVVKGLAARGHHVTLITNMMVGELQSLDNVRQIQIRGLEFRDAMFSDLFQKAALDGATVHDGVLHQIDTLSKLYPMPVRVAQITYSDRQVLQLLASDTYDLVLVSQFMGITGYPLAWHFNASLAVFSPVNNSTISYFHFFHFKLENIIPVNVPNFVF